MPAEATDLIPADLELVLRVDISKVRDSLGPEASAALMDRAVDQVSSEGLIRRALSTSEIVWLGLRLSDIVAGDRVMVVRSIKQRQTSGGELRGRSGIEPDRIAWTPSETTIDGLTRWQAKATAGATTDSTATPRDGTSHIFTFGDRDAVFVSPVEVHSVERVLRRGPDPQRGQPQARGLVSIDYRARSLSPTLRNRFPSLAVLIAGIVRINAIIDVTGKRMQLDGRIRCKTNRAAKKVVRFIETIRLATAKRPRHAELLTELTTDLEDKVVHLRWPLPRTVIRGLLSNEPTGQEKKPAKETTLPPSTGSIRKGMLRRSD